MRRRTELYWIGRGEAAPPSFRYPGHAAAGAHAGEVRARYPAGWADDRPRFPGEIALRDMATTTPEEHVLVLARFAVSRWLHRLLTGAPVWEIEAERRAAHDYAAAALPRGEPAQTTGDAEDLAGAAAVTLHEMTEPTDLQDPDALLAGLHRASAQAAALPQPGGALAMGRFGYLVALGLGEWGEARRFARELAEYVGSHGGKRPAGRWVRRARALEQRLRDSTDGPA